MELITPIGMLAVLAAQDFGEFGIECRMLALVGADLTLEHFHWPLLGAAGFVIPPFDGRETKDGPLAGDGMAPLFLRQCLELMLQLASERRRRQKGTDDA